MKNNLIKWIRIFLLIILNIVNIGLLIVSIYFFIGFIYLLIPSILWGIFIAGYGELFESNMISTIVMYPLCIIFTVILEIYLTVPLIKILIKRKDKGNINSFFYIMLLFIINTTSITSTLLATTAGLSIISSIQNVRILGIFYFIYFIVKERKKVDEKHNNTFF